MIMATQTQQGWCDSVGAARFAGMTPKTFASVYPILAARCGLAVVRLKRQFRFSYANLDAALMTAAREGIVLPSPGRKKKSAV